MGWGLGRPLIHWKCFSSHASAWLRRWGGRQCSPSSPQVLCKTRSTCVPRVCCDVSVSAISMLIITTIVPYLAECWQFYGCSKLSWNFRGFSSMCHRMLMKLCKYFLWLALIFKDVLQMFMQCRWSSVISECVPRFSSNFHRVSLMRRRFSLISDGVSLLFMHFRYFVWFAIVL